MSEKTQVTDKLVKALNKNPDILVWKRFSGRFGNKGYPDITGLVNLINKTNKTNNFKIAIRVEIECKLPGNKPTKIQQSYLTKFKNLGCICFWTDDYKLGLEEFNRQLKHIQLILNKS